MSYADRTPGGPNASGTSGTYMPPTLLPAPASRFPLTIDADARHHPDQQRMDLRHIDSRGDQDWRYSSAPSVPRPYYDDPRDRRYGGTNGGAGYAGADGTAYYPQRPPSRTGYNVPLITDDRGSYPHDSHNAGYPHEYPTGMSNRYVESSFHQFKQVGFTGQRSAHHHEYDYESHYATPSFHSHKRTPTLNVNTYPPPLLIREASISTLTSPPLPIDVQRDPRNDGTRAPLPRFSPPAFQSGAHMHRRRSRDGPYSFSREMTRGDYSMMAPTPTPVPLDFAGSNQRPKRSMAISSLLSDTNVPTIMDFSPPTPSGALTSPRNRAALNDGTPMRPTSIGRGRDNGYIDQNTSVLARLQEDSFRTPPNRREGRSPLRKNSSRQSSAGRNTASDSVPMVNQVPQFSPSDDHTEMDQMTDDLGASDLPVDEMQRDEDEEGQYTGASSPLYPTNDNGFAGRRYPPPGRESGSDSNMDEDANDGLNGNASDTSDETYAADRIALLAPEYKLELLRYMLEMRRRRRKAREGYDERLVKRGKRFKRQAKGARHEERRRRRDGHTSGIETTEPNWRDKRVNRMESGTMNEADARSWSHKNERLRDTGNDEGAFGGRRLSSEFIGEKYQRDDESYSSKRPTPEPPLTDEQRKLAALQTLALSRNNLWHLIITRDIPRAQQLLQHYAVTKISNQRKIASLCAGVVLKTLPFKSTPKDLMTRTKRVAKEVLLFWKRNEREEREARKRAEKERLEERKREEERREQMRQRRKLNFLITQTELYSHFVGRKLGTEVDKLPVNGEANALATDQGGVKDAGMDVDMGNLEDMSFAEIDFDNADDATLTARAKAEAQSALAKQQSLSRNFDAQTGSTTLSDQVDSLDFLNPSSLPASSTISQPTLLTVSLKSYQLKGLNWLANLYEQGINGILADEMGLGKTVQSISLMAYLAERHSIWGPFLVVSPSSTLPNWQTELSKFVPNFKVLPYWGSAEDRKILRSFLVPKKLGLKESPFHVLVTSYQLVVQDASYLGRVRWQYMVLDEAQAIKSSQSQRWKTLLGMKSRNRLLLTGTPIQNSMQELWSLLHFIMPTLFDSHEEFSDWFSKDIESHVESKSDKDGLNEQQLKRLHMILKPFMLRRVKKDVENELADKIEKEVWCGLSRRQRGMMDRLKKVLRVGELLDRVEKEPSKRRSNNNNLFGDDDEGDSLMNLVMQFRKVCNHPELFERADVTSPFSCDDPARAVYPFPVTCRNGEWVAYYTPRPAVVVRIPEMCWGVWMWEGWVPYAWESRMRLWTRDGLVMRRWGESAEWDGLVGYSPSEMCDAFSGNVFQRWMIELERRANGYGRLAEYLAENQLSTPNRVHEMLDIYRPYAEGSKRLYGGDVMDALCSVWKRGEESVVRRMGGYVPAAVACVGVAKKCEKQMETWIKAVLGGEGSVYGGVLAESEKRVVDMFGGWDVERRGFVTAPDIDRLVKDSGKMVVLDNLLPQLKANHHRVLIFFQMTSMMDIFEQYLSRRQHSYLRLDGSTSIFERRDLVQEWQTRDDLFVFLLSTRAGGLGINLTAADTVVFYDSDWNPTVDQQAMDRSHRLGQTKQVTVYRLVTKGTIEERILMRARQKDEIQRVVISGGSAASGGNAGSGGGMGAGVGGVGGAGEAGVMKPKEVLSLLLDDEEMDEKVRREEERREVERQERVEERERRVKEMKNAAARRRREKRKREAVQ
ncbi:putative DNA helicase ino80 [Gaertneriomyces sp. JEL0708]|nr:putative DNA helicase ino80 [Gaertneriomyces sp. JEL0708]